MKDFNYYRDKLTGLSPTTISILTDLDIEQKKDELLQKLSFFIKRHLVQIVFGEVWFCRILNAYPRINAYQQYLKIIQGIGNKGDDPCLVLAGNDVCGSREHCIIYICNRQKDTKHVKHTDYGNLMAECVYGMKNFIHDYSNLNEADRRQAVLWEDYLVYAGSTSEARGGRHFRLSETEKL